MTLLLLSAVSPRIRAAPLLESRVGGLTLAGPAIEHPASVFYNPASLILLPGHHIYLDGTFRLGVGEVSLQPTDSSTGAPLAGSRLPAQDLLETSPQFFLSASSDLGFESVVLALTVHTPYASRFSYQVGGDGHLFDPAQQWAGRYQAVDMTLYSLFVTSSAAFQIVDKLSLGVSFSYAFVATDFAFVRDAALEGGQTRDPGELLAVDDCGAGVPCGYGAAAAAEAIRVRGTVNALAFSAGLLLRPHPRLDIGAAYHSRVLGWGESNVPARGDAWVRRSQASFESALADPELAPGLTRDLTGRGTVSYSLPDMVNVGAAYRATARLLLDLEFRWIHFSVHDQLDVRLSGTQLRAPPQIPDRLVHYRGFQDVYAVQVGAGYQLTPTLLLQGASMLETAALPAPALSPAAIDNLKFDSFVSLRWSLGRGFSLRAGYGLTLMPSSEVSQSVFSASDVVACAEARYDVDLPACRAAAAGKGLSSGNGTYHKTVHRFGLGFAYDLW